MPRLFVLLHILSSLNLIDFTPDPTVCPTPSSTCSLPPFGSGRHFLPRQKCAPWSAFTHFGQSPQPSPTSLSHSVLDILFCDCAFIYFTTAWKAFPSSSGQLLPISQGPVLTLSLSESFLGLTSLRSIVHYIIWIPWPTKPISVCTSSTSSLSVPYSCALCPIGPFPVPPREKTHSRDWFSVPATGQPSYRARLSSEMLFLLLKSSTYPTTWLISSKTLVLTQSPILYYLSGQLNTFLASGTFFFLL